MPFKVDAPKPILKSALEGAIDLRTRQIKAATNPVIQEALEKEQGDLRKAIETMTEIK